MTTEQKNDRWLGLTRAAQLAGVSAMTVHRAAALGELPHATVANRRLFLRSDVLKWAKKRRPA